MDHLPSVRVVEVPSASTNLPVTISTTLPMTSPDVEVPSSVLPRKCKSVETENIPVSDPPKRPRSLAKSLAKQIPALIKGLLFLDPKEKQQISAGTSSLAHPLPESAEVSFSGTEERDSLAALTEAPAQSYPGFGNLSNKIDESPSLPKKEYAVPSNEPEEHIQSELRTMTSPDLPPRTPNIQFADPEQQGRPTSTMQTPPPLPSSSPKRKISIKLKCKKSVTPEIETPPIISLLGEDIDDLVMPSIEGMSAAELQLNGLERSTSRPVNSAPTLFDISNLFGKAAETPDETMCDASQGLQKEELDVFGCILCGPEASCIIHEAYDEADIRQIVCAETFDNRHHKPGIEIAGIEASIKMAEYEKNQLAWDVADKGPFCCTTVKYDERASAVGLPDEKEEQIKAFMTLLNEKNDISIIYCTNEYSQEQMQAIRQVVKVNPVKNFEEQSTYLFAPADADSKENGIDYYGFLYIDSVHRFEKHGGNAYLAYFCKEHEMKYRIGFNTVKWSKDGKTWATTGDARMDKAMQLPTKQEFSPLGYPRMGFEYKSRTY